ncbi:glycosyl hydrolase, putative [Trichophyton verrucosum HKI 0517]|uniref:Glycosyl hydrolase, putative n=1 Tax=Trichophyton verrucosum (strain HKI 0517) TaxID=663202 RepID=D4DB27_TRIVH|nr:glycosyl hydrolase, putative [Trichophyton verrucosum HKI 0517]EFE40966.1 glycosyl hydrolase, putative [Trichophyton verrucosum HKI 0517]
MYAVRPWPTGGHHSFSNFPLLALICISTILLLCARTSAAPFDLSNGDISQQIIIIDDDQQAPFIGTEPKANVESSENDQEPFPGDASQFPWPHTSKTLRTMLETLHVMQSEYFSLWQATWPTGIDWTKAVVNTHILSALSLLSSTLGFTVDEPWSGCYDEAAMSTENLISYYFQQTSAFWHGENFFGIRLQAYDDMLWVVLEWLESIKFQNLHSELHFGRHPNSKLTPHHSWHGTQYRAPAAHRARVFYDLAVRGWDTQLCGGGMIWSPWLTPYKNAITNELFISASIDMYLYFPGDPIDSPIVESELQENGFVSLPRDPIHLDAAITAYKWLKSSNMTGANGLYADGFHIHGWTPNDSGTGKCDVLNTMVYTYNQGVILSGLRGLWLATGDRRYFEDGHDLVRNVIKATGWPAKSDHTWHGLGRAGVLEDACDSTGLCSQDGQTFKGIFFHHFAEFCRQLSPQEKRMLSDPALHKSAGGNNTSEHERRNTFRWHQRICASYLHWLEHNAYAAFVTKNEKGLYGMWWGPKYPDGELSNSDSAVVLPHGAVDYSNSDPPINRASPDLALLQAQGNRTYFAKEAPSDIVGDQLRPFPHEFQDTVVSRPEGGDPGAGPNVAKAVKDVNDRGRGRTLETQSGALAVFKALYQWHTTPSLRR